MARRMDQLYLCEVLHTTQLTPHMVRVTLGGSGLQGFVSPVADDRVSVYLPEPRSRHVPLPDKPGGAGYLPSTRPATRTYSVRRWDQHAGQLDIDFVIHEHGLAAAWATRAQPGDRIAISGADSWFAPPADTTWLLLVADMTGLPALGRIVEEAGAGTQVRCLIEILEEADRQEFTTAAELDVQWLIGSGHGRSPSQLAQVTSSLEIDAGAGYIWFAGETSDSRKVRRHLQRDRGIPKDRMVVVGYWRNSHGT